MGSITHRVRPKLLLLALLSYLSLVLRYLAVGLAVIGRHMRRLHLHGLCEFYITLRLTSNGGVIRNGVGSIEVLIITILLADYNVIGEVDLDCAIDEVCVFITAFLAHLPGTVVELLNYVFVLGALGSPAHDVLFVGLFVDGGVVAVAVGLALVPVLLQPHQFPLQIFAFLLNLSQGLSRDISTSKSCEYLFSSFYSFFSSSSTFSSRLSR